MEPAPRREKQRVRSRMRQEHHRRMDPQALRHLVQKDFQNHTKVHRPQNRHVDLAQSAQPLDLLGHLLRALLDPALQLLVLVQDPRLLPPLLRHVPRHREHMAVFLGNGPPGKRPVASVFVQVPVFEVVNGLARFNLALDLGQRALQIVGMDEFGKGALQKLLDAPAQRVAEGRVQLLELAVAVRDAQHVQGDVEKLGVYSPGGKQVAARPLDLSLHEARALRLKCHW
jgi:hypothetical protein